MQSVALKLVVDREKEIEAFIPVEYWNIAAFEEAKMTRVSSLLYTVEGKRIEKEPSAGKEVFPQYRHKEAADASSNKLKKPI